MTNLLDNGGHSSPILLFISTSFSLLPSLIYISLIFSLTCAFSSMASLSCGFIGGLYCGDQYASMLLLITCFLSFKSLLFTIHLLHASLYAAWAYFSLSLIFFFYIITKILQSMLALLRPPTMRSLYFFPLVFLVHSICFLLL